MNKDPSSPSPVFNGFLPEKDGFIFSNTIKDDYMPDGRCEGISTFTKWYYNTYGSGLASKFTAPIPTKTSKQISLTGQEVIATRSQISVALYMTPPTWFTDDLAVGNAYSIMLVQDALSKGAPAVMAGLVGAGGHAVLAIGFTDKQIAVYDSNHPMKVKAIDYKFTGPGRATINYGNFDQLDVWGNGELPLREPLANILRDAQASFHGENQTQIEVTSHQSGEKVSSQDIVLEGMVHSGEVAISEVEARVVYEDLSESEPQAVTLAPGVEDFSVPLKLRKGQNVVLFTTRGYVKYGEGLREITNDRDGSGTREPFVLVFEENPHPPVSLLTINGSATVTTPTGEDTTTVSYSANLSYRTWTQILNPSFDFSLCNNPDDGWCRIISAATVDNITDLLNSSLLPVNINYHAEGYTLDDKGQVTSSYHYDGSGTISCNGFSLKIFAEPGATAANHTYRLTIDPTGICLGGGITISGQSCDYWGCSDHSDTVTLYSISALQSLHVDNEVLSCQSPPRIQSSDIEPWVADQNVPKSLVLTSGVDCQANDETRKEDTTVSLTLVP